MVGGQAQRSDPSTPSISPWPGGGLESRLAAAVPPERRDDALVAYHDARVAGLCHDGAWEIALAADSPAEPTPEPTP